MYNTFCDKDNSTTPPVILNGVKNLKMLETAQHYANSEIPKDV